MSYVQPFIVNRLYAAEDTVTQPVVEASQEIQTHHDDIRCRMYLETVLLIITQEVDITFKVDVMKYVHDDDKAQHYEQCCHQELLTTERSPS
jgi:hypothetical protein